MNAVSWDEIEKRGRDSEVERTQRIKGIGFLWHYYLYIMQLADLQRHLSKRHTPSKASANF
jgi:hypothetical protein